LPPRGVTIELTAADAVPPHTQAGKKGHTMKDHAFNAAVVFCYLVKDGKVLLIKREKPPAFKQYTIVGGKKEPGEDLYAACKREVYEETGLEVENLKLKGVISNFIEGRDFEVTTYYFLSDRFSGELNASDEGALEWCDIQESYHKDGISEYYVKISPLVLERDGVFLASMSSDKNGNVARFEVHP
jgi:8-oxo-dGTP diphosphatase